MNIATNIRKLRRDKDITQEKLASVLNVSFQTVSKWERGESYPDITFLPIIAAFFGTTTDILLGTDEEYKKIRSLEVSKQLSALRKTGRHEGVIEYLRQYINENPDDYMWRKVLAWEIIEYADTLENMAQIEKLNREALEIYEYILEFNIPDELRYEIDHYVIESLWSLGENEKANKLAEKYHYPMAVMDLGAIQMKYLKGRQRVGHASGRIIDAVTQYCEAIDCMVDFDDGYGCGFSDAEKLERLILEYRIVSLIFEGNCQGFSERVSQLCAKIADIYARTGDTDRSFEYINLAAEYAVDFDKLRRIEHSEEDAEQGNRPIVVSQFTSILTNGLNVGTYNARLYKEPTACGELLHTWLNRPSFDGLRSDIRFDEIEQQLQKHITIK